MRDMKNGKIQTFTDLQTWKEGHSLVLMIYTATKAFPQRESFSLVDQLRRAVTSITSNIAEGFGRQSYKEKIQFYYLSQGSLEEVKNQLLIARDVGYITKELYESLLEQSNITHQLLQGLIHKSKTFIQNK